MPKRAIPSSPGGASSSAVATQSLKRIRQSIKDSTQNPTPTIPQVAQKFKLISLPPETLDRIIYWFLADTRRGCSHCEQYRPSAEMPQGQLCLQQVLPLASTCRMIYQAVSSCLTTDALWRDFIPTHHNTNTHIYRVLRLTGINLADVKLEFSWYMFAAQNLQEIDLSCMSGDDVTLLLGKLVPYQPRLRSLSLRRIGSKVVGVSSAVVVLKRLLKNSARTLQTLTIPSRPVAVRDAILATRLSSIKDLTYVPIRKLKGGAESLSLILAHLRDVNAPLQDLSLPTVSGEHWMMPNLSVLAPSVHVLHLRDDNPIIERNREGLRRYDVDSLKGLLKNIVTLIVEGHSAPAAVSLCISNRLLPCLKNLELTLKPKTPASSVLFMEHCNLAFPVFGSSLRKLVIHDPFTHALLSRLRCHYCIVSIAENCPNLEILDLRMRMDRKDTALVLSDYIRKSKHLREISLAHDLHDYTSLMDTEANMITCALLSTSSNLERVRQVLFYTKPADTISLMKKHGKWLKCLHLNCILRAPVSNFGFLFIPFLEMKVSEEDGVKIYETAQSNCPKLENLEFGVFDNMADTIPLYLSSEKHQIPEQVQNAIAQTKNILPNFKDKSVEWK